MGIKSKVKTLIKMTRKKQLIPIENNVDYGQMLNGKKAVIVGGSGGIGLAIAKSFCESGCSVVVCGTNEDKLNRVINEFPENAIVKTQVFDITKLDELESNVKKAVDAFGGVDFFVNSAGVHTEKVDFFSMTPSEFDRVMGVNIRSTYFICQKFAEQMILHRSEGKKHILLISSSRGSEPAWSPYGISKWSLNGFTKGLAQILLPYGIVVNAIAPGTTATELIGIKPGDDIASEENKIGRLIMPDEVANIAKLLVSSAGDMIVGETIHVSGGRGIIDIR